MIENLPLTHAEQARPLLRHWLTSEPDQFEWNGKGNIIIDGRLVLQSNIVEVLPHISEKGGNRDGSPVGQLEVAQFIGTSGTPMNLIGNLDVAETTKKLSEPTKKATKRQRRQQQQR
ncbi:hypothetical protein QAD02_007946 [Eretmocerus hayati]|uniref:Uncharacterized protein n=1 Tax=Eretmocerus hayati TaxID=131215 RepID=A0ACC2N5E8_9HYME|nr:hypothetical protein QAD02_007946 [Eretmocerus hayati]